MFYFTDATIGKIIVHHVGNKNQNEGLKFSKHLINIKEDFLKELLLQYFLNPFKTEALYEFTNLGEDELNVVCHSVSNIFEDTDCFAKESVKIAKHLYEKSEHPKIKGGEFYIVYFKSCVVGDEVTDAIGLFKSENKDTFLRVYQKQDDFEIESQEGINIHKLDKGCIIFNTDKESGYIACMVDNLNKSGEAQFWKDDFLGIKQREDDFYHTKTMLNVCKDFCDEFLHDDQEVTRQQQFLIKDRSMKYFAENENYNEKEFEEEVMQEPEVIEAFQHYKQKYMNSENTAPAEDFGISDSAVKGARKFFKSVLKLDKNFHVYIHGNPDLVEKGFDDKKKMNYYRLFFNEEV